MYKEVLTEIPLECTIKCLHYDNEMIIEEIIEGGVYDNSKGYYVVDFGTQGWTNDWVDSSLYGHDKYTDPKFFYIYDMKLLEGSTMGNIISKSVREFKLKNLLK